MSTKIDPLVTVTLRASKFYIDKSEDNGTSARCMVCNSTGWLDDEGHLQHGKECAVGIALLAAKAEPEIPRFLRKDLVQ